MTPLQGGEFGTPTDTDHRPWLWVAVVISCSYSGFALFVRLFTKWGFLNIEDALIGVAYVCPHAKVALTAHELTGLEGFRCGELGPNRPFDPRRARRCWVS